MKLFIDSAEISEIESAAKTGLVDGVTTNPSLVAKAGMPFEKLLHRICELVDGPISAEVTTGWRSTQANAIWASDWPRARASESRRRT